MSPPKAAAKNSDTDDVLDFINSLPDSKPSTPQPHDAKKSTDGGENKEELLDFLDELTAHEKKSSGTSTPTQTSKSKFEPKSKKEPEQEHTKQEDTKDTETKDKQDTETKDKQETSDNANEELEIDPIGSISSWWNTQGSNKVSSLWGSIASNAVNLSETTFQLASNTTNQLSQQRQNFLKDHAGVAGIVESEQLVNISSRLNSILLNMSQQIKEGLISDDDELLNILLIYDLTNWNNLDQLCYDKFYRVMNQVEGGIKVSVNNFNHKNEASKAKGDNIDLNMFQGKIIDGEKLCFANLDSSVKDYMKILQLEEESKKLDETEQHEPINEINKSNIFISIQPISSGGQAASREDNTAPVLIESNNANSFAFTLILKDITNNITIINKSQPFPVKWARWLNGDHDEFKSLFGGAVKQQENQKDTDEETADEETSVAPGEWVKEWIEDGLSLSFGVLAQEYVAKRMGV